MKLNRIAASLLFGFGALALSAGELTPEVTAKFLKVIASTSGQGKIACNEATVRAALTAQGVTVDTGSAVVWCTNAAEVRSQKQMGKLVVVGRRDLSAQACILIEEEDGRPRLMLNSGNIRASRITLSDSLLKIGEKL
jgi:hypothetical protein